MIRKISSIAAVLLILVMLILPAVAADNSRSYLFALSVDGKTEKTVEKGDIITVTLNLTRTDSQNGNRVYAMQDEICYDSRYFELVSGGTMVTNGIRYTDLSLKQGMHAFYMNFVSMDQGEEWSENQMIGIFQLKVLAENGTTWLRNTNYLVSTQDGKSEYASVAQDVKIIIGNGKGYAGEAATENTILVTELTKEEQEQNKITVDAKETDGVVLSGEAVKALGETEMALTVRNDAASVSLPAGAFAEYAFTENDEVILTIVRNSENEYVCSLTCNGEALAFQGTAVVALPVPEQVAHLVVLRISDSGESSGVRALQEGEQLNVETDSIETFRIIPAAEYPIPFEDVKDSGWYRDSVGYVYANSLFIGMTEDTFEPETETTRAMVMMILYRLENAKTVEKSWFSDIPADAWYADAVNWAASVGIAQGFEDGTFHPNERVSREQLAAFFCRYVKYKGLEITEIADLTNYEDSDSISDWAYEAVCWANARGLIRGRTDTKIVPLAGTTRAEFATVLMRYIESR